MNEWIKCSDKLPELSYFESDNTDDPYECFPVLVYSQEEPGIYCVAYLQQEQDEAKLSFGDLSWQLYLPGNGGEIVDRDLETFTHWMPLPSSPEKQDN